MKNVLNLIILIISLTTKGQSVKHLVNWIPEKDTLIEIKYKNLLHIGKVAKINGRVSVMKTGIWKTYDIDRKLICKGEYKIGTYTYCGMIPTQEYYHYKTGIWSFYNTYDIVKFDLEFIPKEHFIPNNCQSGGKILFGIIDKIPDICYFKITSDEIYNLQKVLYHEWDGVRILTPLNSKAFVKKIYSK